jgi:hypothetical protein
MEIPSIDLMGPDVREAIPPDLLALGRGQYQVTPDELRRGSVGKPTRVRFVVAPSYRRGSKTTLEPMSRAEALVTMADQSFNFGRFGAKALPLLERVVKGAECYRLGMGDLAAAVQMVMDLTSKTAPRTAVLAAEKDRLESDAEDRREMREVAGLMERLGRKG